MSALYGERMSAELRRGAVDQLDGSLETQILNIKRVIDFILGAIHAGGNKDHLFNDYLKDSLESTIAHLSHLRIENLKNNERIKNDR